MIGAFGAAGLSTPRAVGWTTLPAAASEAAGWRALSSAAGSRSAQHGMQMRACGEYDLPRRCAPLRPRLTPRLRNKASHEEGRMRRSALGATRRAGSTGCAAEGATRRAGVRRRATRDGGSGTSSTVGAARRAGVSEGATRRACTGASGGATRRAGETEVAQLTARRDGADLATELATHSVDGFDHCTGLCRRELLSPQEEWSPM